MFTVTDETDRARPIGIAVKENLDEAKEIARTRHAGKKTIVVRDEGKRLVYLISSEAVHEIRCGNDHVIPEDKGPCGVTFPGPGSAYSDDALRVRHEYDRAARTYEEAEWGKPVQTTAECQRWNDRNAWKLRTEQLPMGN